MRSLIYNKQNKLYYSKHWHYRRQPSWGAATEFEVKIAENLSQ
jgi:hypothetical protein